MENNAFQLLHEIKKHSSKQVLSIAITHTLEESFLLLLLLKVCESFQYEQSEKFL